MAKNLPNQHDPLLQYRQEANLAFFMHDRFSYVLQCSVNLDSLPEITAKFARNSLLESYLWLYWGVATGYFPRERSRRIIYEYFGTVLKAYEAVVVTQEIETWFALPSRTIFEAEFNGRRELFASENNWEKYLDQLSSVFHTVFILANAYAERPSTRLLVQALAFASDGQWSKAISDQLPVDAWYPFESEKQVSPGSEHWAVPGFFASLDFMESFRQARNDFEASMGSSVSEFYNLLNSLKETQQWRLNFGYAPQRQRFMQVAELVGNTYARQNSIAGKSNLADDIKGFSKEIYSLMTDWQAPVAKSATGD